MKNDNDAAIQRVMMLVIAILLLLAGGIGEFRAQRFGTSPFNAALLRVGFVLLACWIAYPVLRRPAAWLPAGATTVGVLLIGAVVFQPKLLVVLIPMFGTLLGVGALVRSFRRGGKK